MKKTFIAFVSSIIGCLLLFSLVGCTKEQPSGSGESIVTGIYARFNTEYETLKGSENIDVYHLKAGETYELYVSVSFKGSKDVRLNKSSVKVYYDTQLFAFDEGEYLDESDGETPTDGYPFYFTCYDTPSYTEIFIVANGYWCKVNVIIEN